MTAPAPRLFSGVRITSDGDAGWRVDAGPSGGEGPSASTPGGAPRHWTYRLSSTVEARFPFLAYDVQVDYMKRVVEALDTGDNALLESPTGTGKTLCLLAAVLAWREAQAARLGLAGPGGGFGEGSEGAAPRKALGAMNPAGPGPSSEAMAALDDRLVAGGGALPPRAIPALVYSSRTHGQLTQVARELRRLVPSAHRARAAPLASRAQLCPHPDVQPLPTGAAQARCASLCQSGRCGWGATWQRMSRNPSELTHHVAGIEVTDVEDLLKSAGAPRAGGGDPRGAHSANRPCPFFLSRHLARSADVVLLPYGGSLGKRITLPGGRRRSSSAVVPPPAPLHPPPQATL